MTLDRTPTTQDLVAHLRSFSANVLYTQPVLNRKGKTREGRYVTEEIAQLLLQDNLLQGIAPIQRAAGYCTGHSKDMAQKSSNRVEECLAIHLFKCCPAVLDYQVPLKNKRSDQAGKVDLLLLHEGELYLGELKGENSDESLLRAVLEIETYWRTLDKLRLLSDYKDKGVTSNQVQKAVVLFSGSRPCKEWRSPEHLLVRKLAEQYSVRVISADALKGPHAIRFL